LSEGPSPRAGTRWPADSPLAFPTPLRLVADTLNIKYSRLGGALYTRLASQPSARIRQNRLKRTLRQKNSNRAPARSPLILRLD